MPVTTMSGDRFECGGVGRVCVETTSGQRAELDVLVTSERPMGVEMVLGITGITALGGVSVESASEVRFCGAVCRPPPAVDAPDFTARFDPVGRKWMVAWKWEDGVGPACLTNGVPEYAIPATAREEFDGELQLWMDNGWLVPYDEELYGQPRGLLPLMAVEQKNKVKIRPVLDYRELNSHVAAHTAEADVCADQLRKWRRHGSNIAVVDLKKAYLQLHTDQRLWPYQTVVIRGKRYALTRVGFGLNVAPLIMKAVVRSVLAEDPNMEKAVLPYVDDLCVNEDVVSAEQVVSHFAKYGLDCKAPERAADGARLLGLRVRTGAGGVLSWARDNAVGTPPVDVTRRTVFSWCGRLVAHLPVCGWLRPAVAWLKRRVNCVTQGWDDIADDAALRDQIGYVASRLASEDAAHGRWCVSGDRAVVWTDASSVAAGVVMQTPDGNTIEDACWLRRDDTTHINMAELDAAVRGINLAVAWSMKTVELRTDSATVHHWISDALSGRARLRTKAHGEMLIRRRVDIIRQLVDELELSLSVTLVRSAENVADSLTRVPSEWLRSDVTDGPEPVGAAAVTSDEGVAVCESAHVDRNAVAGVHVRAGHPGIRRTLFFARREISRAVTRAQVREVVTACDVCRAVDPAPVKWRPGSLDVEETWWRLAADITHYQGQSFLSVIDCGPSRFCLWRPLRRSDSASIVAQLEQVFSERGAPEELLLDNDTAFRSREFAVFAARWRVRLRFRAVHRPSGNSIVERNHRSVKVIAARTECSVAEAVHLYNVTPRDGETVADAPANGVYRYTVRDCVRAAVTPSEVTDPGQTSLVDEPPVRGPFDVGDVVWVRKPATRCTEWSRSGVVTRVVSPQVVEVEGVPWHVRDVRLCSERSDVRVIEPGWPLVDDASPMYVSSGSPVPEAVEHAVPALVCEGMDIAGDDEMSEYVTVPDVLMADVPAVADAAGGGDVGGRVDVGVEGARVGNRGDGESVEQQGGNVSDVRRSQRSRRPPDRFGY